MATTQKKTGTVKVVKKAANKGVSRKSKSAKKNVPSSPLVSVVVPAHNAADFIDDTIHSVLGQSYENWELIIVDDHSTDKTLEVVRRFKSERIKVIALSRNGGAAKARNKGVSAARGRYICFLDADDLWQPNKIARQVRFMEETGAAFGFASYVFADAKGRPNGKVVRVPTSITYKQALKNTVIWTSTVILDMKKIRKTDIRMPDVGCEDMATWWKVLKKIDRAYGLREVMAIYRRSGKTLSSNKFVMARRVWNLYRNCEYLNLIESLGNFVGYAFNAVKKRV